MLSLQPSREIYSLSFFSLSAQGSPNADLVGGGDVSEIFGELLEIDESLVWRLCGETISIEF